MQSSNLLLVGGSGSVGNFLAENLSNFDSIHIIDKKQPKNKSLNFHQCDLTDIQTLKKIYFKFPNDLPVLYLTGNLTNLFSSDEVSQSIKDNLEALSNFITIFNSKISKLIFISSVSVYGIPQYLPINESHPTNPITLYGTIKKCAEILAQTQCKNFDISLTIIRLTQIYGILSAENTLPHILVNHLKEKKTPKIYCNPEHKRDYLHISEFCRFIDKLLLNYKSGIFNVGSGEGIKILDLFKTSFAFVDKKLDLEIISKRDLQPSFSQVLDITKIKKDFGFKPSITITDWLKDQLKK